MVTKALVFYSFTIFIGNLAAYFLHRRFRISLAVADLLPVTVMSSTLGLYLIYSLHNYPLISPPNPIMHDQHFINAFGVLLVLSYFASIFMLVVISMDR